MSLASDLTAARHRLGLSQRDLAKQVGLTPNTISRLERGEPYRPATVLRIAETLGVQLEATDAGQLRVAGVSRTDERPPSVTEQLHTVAVAEARIVLDLPEDALKGLSPARRELVITRAKLAALQAAQEQQTEQARTTGDGARP